MTAHGVLRPLLDRATRPVVLADREASLPALLNLPAWTLVIAVAVLVALALAWLPRPGREAGRWPWHWTGIALGILGTGAWLAGRPAGWTYGLSMTGPTRSLFEFFLTGGPDLLDWGVFMLIGLTLGVRVSAAARGPLVWSVPPGPEAWQRFTGGLLMGVGGTMAGGCNIGNAVTGFALLALNALVATAGILAGVWLATRRAGPLRSAA